MHNMNVDMAPSTNFNVYDENFEQERTTVPIGNLISEDKTHIKTCGHTV